MATAAGKGIQVIISGDYKALKGALNAVTQEAKDTGAAISAAMKGSLNQSSAERQIKSLAQSMVFAHKNAAALKQGLTGVDADLAKVARAAGLAEKQFAGLTRQMIQKHTATNLERNMANIQRLTGASAIQMAKLRLSVGDATGALRTMGNAAAEGLGKIANMRNAIIAGAVGVTMKEAGKTAMEFDTFQRSFNAIAGGPAGGADMMKFVREEANRLGQDLFKLADSYRGLAAASMSSGLSQKQVRDVFSAVGEAATTLGLSSDQTKYALYALQQMMSKGVVSMEELRRQLGDSLPGAFSAAARAMGVTERELIKMVESGELMSKDFLPRFAAELRNTFGAGFAEAANSARSQFNRLGNAIKEFAGAFGGGFLDDAAAGATRLADVLKENEGKIEALGKIVGSTFNAIIAVTGVTLAAFEASSLGLEQIARRAVATAKGVAGYMNPFADSAKAVKQYAAEMATLDAEFKQYSDRIGNELAVALGQADAGMKTAAASTANAVKPAYEASDAYRDLAAAMAMISGGGAALGKTIEGDIEILQKYTANARSAAKEAKEQAASNAQIAFLNLQSRADALIGQGKFEEAAMLNRELEKQAQRLGEVARGEIGLEKAKRGGSSAAREAEKAHKDEYRALKLVTELQKEYENLTGHTQESQLKALELQELKWRELARGIKDATEAAQANALIDQIMIEKKSQLSGDALPGLTRAMREYVDGLTPAKAAADMFNSSTDAMTSALTDIFTGAKSAKEAFAEMAKTIANDLMRLVVQMMIMRPIVQGFMGLLGGGGGISFMGGVTSPVSSWSFGFAKGGAFRSAGLASYANSVVSSPTIFPFARGAGLMGEAGPEAIMPLKRDSRGRLGVSAAADDYQSSEPAKMEVNSKFNIQVNYNPAQGGNQDDARKVADMVGRQIEKQVSDLIDRRLLEQMRAGGLLRPAR